MGDANIDSANVCRCLSDVTFIQPSDPIEFIGKWLHKFRADQLAVNAKLAAVKSADNVLAVTACIL